jgi:hypothetical protein
MYPPLRSSRRRAGTTSVPSALITSSASAIASRDRVHVGQLPVPRSWVALRGEQEVALRALVGTSTAAPVGMADLRELVSYLSSARVAVSAPASEVWLPAQIAGELFAAVSEAAHRAQTLSAGYENMDLDR